MDRSLNVTECNFVVNVVDCGVAANVCSGKKIFGSSPFSKKNTVRKATKKGWSNMPNI